MDRFSNSLIAFRRRFPADAARAARARAMTASTTKTDGWTRYTSVPVDEHDPTSSAPWLPIWCRRGFAKRSRTLKKGGRATFITGYAGNSREPGLDEVVFRFNRRGTRHATFRSLSVIAVNAEPAGYNMLVRTDQCA